MLVDSGIDMETTEVGGITSGPDCKLMLDTSSTELLVLGNPAEVNPVSDTETTE